LDERSHGGDRNVHGVAAAVDIVNSYIDALPGAGRRTAHGEWGLTIDADHAGGWPLDVGVRIADGLLTAKAHALSDPEHVDPWMLLWWNRSTRHVRFGCTQSREIWVHADLAATAVSERDLDRLLGLVVEAAIAVRGFQRAKREPPPESGGWLPAAD
jgi:hypothetical protein